MIREHDRRAVADLQVFGRDGNALAAQFVHLFQQLFGVDDRAVAEDVDHAFAENTAGQEVQRKLTIFVDHGVARVVAALIAHDDVVIRRDQVYHTAFSFVTPVDSYDCTVHFYRSFPI